MIVLRILFAASLTAFAFATVSPELEAFFAPAAAAVVVCLLLLGLVSAFRPKSRKPRRSSRGYLVVDGSNIMYWKDETPKIGAVRDVVRHLTSLGYDVGVMFDANAGYLVADRYMHDQHFAKMLRLPRDRVFVVPKGEPADPFILRAARDLRARIVTNDRYRDWIEDYPEIRKPGHLIRGGYRDGRLWFELEDEKEREPA